MQNTIQVHQKKNHLPFKIKKKNHLPFKIVES